MLLVTLIYKITSLHCVTFVMTFEMSVRVILCNVVEQNSIENLVTTEYFSIQNSLHFVSWISLEVTVRCNFRLAFWGRFCYRYCEEVGRSNLFLDDCHFEGGYDWEILMLWVTCIFFLLLFFFHWWKRTKKSSLSKPSLENNHPRN